MAKKVLHITYSPGGVTTYLKNLSLLSPKDIVHFVVSPDVHQNSVYRIVKRNFSLYDPLEVLKILRIVRSIKPDIIHLHSSKAGLYFRFLSIFYTTNYSSHAFAFLDKSSKIHKLYFMAEKLLCKAFNKVSYIGNSVGDSERAKGIGFKNIRTLPNPCVFPEKTENSEKPIRYKKQILIVGRLTSQKNQTTLARFLKRNQTRLRDYKFKFIGLGEIGSKKDEQEFLEIIKGIPNIETAAWISQDQLFEVYRNSYALITFSKFESFGYVNVEAMAHGLPVFSSNVDGPPDYISSGFNGFILEDLEELIDILQQWKRAPGEYQQIRRNARDSALILSDKRETAIRIADTYNNDPKIGTGNGKLTTHPIYQH